MSTVPAAEANDWRSNIPQSYRSAEINTIADVLARLEPGATSASKLMLASQFENMMFTASTDLADYRKKIQKRLKKMQKNYKPPAAMNGEALLEQKKEAVVQLQRKLKSMYGEKLELIVKYGRHTVKEFREKCGDQKSKNLMVRKKKRAVSHCPYSLLSILQIFNPLLLVYSSIRSLIGSC